MQLGKAYAKPLPIAPIELEPAERRDYLAIDDADGNGTPDWQDELQRSGVTLPSPNATSTETASSTDPLSNFGAAVAQTFLSGYLSLSQYNAYTPERGEQLANTIADNFRAPVTFVPHTTDELLLETDTTMERALEYRADMRVALEPLITDEEHELTLFAGYIESGDSSWLDRLARAAENYRAAEENLLDVRIPQDAAPEHLRVMNAVGAFAHTLERMVRFANDPLANLALLRTYNDSEREFDLAFDALVKYYARKVGN